MLKLAVQNLLSRPLRSLLALLGLTVAIAGMVGLFSVAEGIDDMVTDTFGRIPGLMAVQPGTPVPIFSRVPAEWGDEIAKIPGVAIVNHQIWARANTIEGKMIFSPPRFLFGTDIESRLSLKRGIYREGVVEGRFLTPADEGTLNTVISQQIAEEFGKGVGDTLNVNGQDLPIVGIYNCGSLLLDVSIILDIEQVRTMAQMNAATVSGFYIEQTGEIPDEELIARINKTLNGRTLQPWLSSSQAKSIAALTKGSSGNILADFFKSLDRKVKSLAASPVESAEASQSGDEPSQSNQQSSATEDDRSSALRSEPVAASLGTVMKDRQVLAAESAESSDPAHSDAPSSPVPEANHDETQMPLEIRSASDWAEQFDEFRSDLDVFLAILTGIGVTIAVLSIINTMLMSVTERIIEFGILRANGWSKADIMKLITFESALLGVGGGALGCLLGWLGTQAVNWNWPTRMHLVASPELLLFSMLFSVSLGVLGGLYPAIWASRLSPMEAIRRA